MVLVLRWWRTRMAASRSSMWLVGPGSSPARWMRVLGGPGGAGEFQHGPVRVDPDPPLGVMLDQVVPSTERPGIFGACLSALVGMPVVELFSVVHVAAPDGLPAGRELAHVAQRGDLVSQFLGGPIGQGPGRGDLAGVGIGDQGVDGGGGRGDAA